MDQADKDKIRANFRYMVGQLRVGDIRDYLYEKGVLNEDDFEELESGRRTNRDNVRTLLRILVKKGNKAYGIFCDALNECEYEHVVATLEKTDLTNVQYESEDELDSFVQQSGNFVELQRLLWKQTEQMELYKHHIDDLQKEHSELKTSKDDLNKKIADLEKQIRTTIRNEDILKYLEDYLTQKDRGDSLAFVSPRHSTIAETRQMQLQMGSIVTENQRVIASIAVALGQDVISFLLAPSDQKPPAPNRYAVTMRRIVTIFVKEKASSFLEFMETISFTNTRHGFPMLKVVADELFCVGENNWGRIVALYAFTGYLAMHSVEDKMTSINTYLGKYIGDYVAQYLTTWIEQKGGWDDFEEFFREKDIAFSWTGVLITAIALGMLASIVSVRGST